MESAASNRNLSSFVPIHNREDFQGMRAVGQLVAACLDFITDYVEPGMTTGELDRLCAEFQRRHGAVPAPLNYRGFPKSICTSVNHVVCHGIPGNKVLAKGDIVNIDVTAILDGWHGDSSRMYGVGEIGRKAQRLIDVTHEALMRGISVVRPGATLGDIGHAIQSYVEKQGYAVVEDFCGHGLGRVFHDQPSILHYGRPGEGLKLAPGMFFTIEPMVNAGGKEVKILEDGWTAVTRDRSLSAQFEHSIGVREDGCDIFTLSPQTRLPVSSSLRHDSERSDSQVA